MDFIKNLLSYSKYFFNFVLHCNDSIFYLQTRGIRKEKATQILIKAFAHEVIKQFSNDTIRDEAQTYIDEWMNG